MKVTYRLALGVVAAVLCMGVNAWAAGEKQPLPIIPGAAGFGMETPAGSGRHLPVPMTTVHKVTNLNESGPGSLREALAAKEPRVIVFEVSGYIDLKGSTIGIDSPYVTVAGQTAPWPGIVIKGGQLAVGNHDVLIQHIGVRAGDQIPGRYMPHRGCLETANDSSNVVLDHLSVGWSHQCALGLNGENATARLSICSEGWYNAGHNEPEHAKGMFVNVNRSLTRGNSAVVGVLFAHNCDRNPNVNNGARLAFVNNVVYDYAVTGLKLVEFFPGRASKGVDSVYALSVQGNVFAPGPDTGGDPERPWRGTAAWICLSSPASRVFFSPDNLIDGKTYDNPWERIYARRLMDVQDSDNPAADGDVHWANGRENKPEPKAIVREPPVAIPGYEVKPAKETEAWVLANVGPFPARRNPIDARIVYEAKTRTGHGRDDMDDAGGWPKLEENRRELTLPENPNAMEQDGYTRLEKWLHAFADEVEGRKGPVAGADPELGKREAERCAARPDAKALAAEMKRIQALPKADWTFDAAEAKKRQERAAKDAGLPVVRKVELGDGVAIELVLIPPGEFMMGSKYPRSITRARSTGGVNLCIREYPARRVRITKPYYIGQYEVAEYVWDKVLVADSKNDSRLPAAALTAFRLRDQPGGDQYFIAKLNETVGRKEGLTFRLPTEAEWEYACRAGTDTPFWFGEQIATNQANYNGEPWYPEPKELPYQPRGMKPKEPSGREWMPVGSFAPNAWGLYDTVGNATELVQGYYGVYPDAPDPLVDPQAPMPSGWGGIRMIRGGGGDSYPADCRSGYGGYLAVYGDRERAGLRLAAEPAGASSTAGH